MREFWDRNINVIALSILSIFFGVLSLKNGDLGKAAVTALIGALSAIMVQRMGNSPPPSPPQPPSVTP